MNLHQIIWDCRTMESNPIGDSIEARLAYRTGVGTVLRILEAFAEELRQDRDRSSVEEMMALNKVLGERASFTQNPPREGPQT